jgi:hypothetical protein
LWSSNFLLVYIKYRIIIGCSVFFRFTSISFLRKVKYQELY